MFLYLLNNSGIFCRDEFGGHDKVRMVSIRAAGAKLQELFGVDFSSFSTPTLSNVDDILTSQRFSVVQNALLYNGNKF